ncbi:MAG: MotA/TolQ/ExbB proton channel family protein [Gemmatimonadales bacterium]|nr:MotA/TolQ/ExbB proton channel family protein [Gemmatimonadales bacterium]
MFAEFNWLEWMTNSPIFLVLIGCSIVTLAVAGERAWYYFGRRGDSDIILENSLRKIRKGDLGDAGRDIESTRHPLGPVVSQLFESKEVNGKPADERLQISLSQQKMLLEKNLGVLGTMAAVAPLIGLLGTIWGIMRAFHSMSLTGSTSPSVVASGVAEALLTTAAGIIIAVPAILLYNHYTRRMNVMLTVAENCARSVRAAILETVN